MALNKLIMFPVTFMMIFTLVSFFTSGGSSESVTIPNSGGIVVNVWGLTGFALGALLLISAMAGVDVLAGLHILGSGITDASQTLLFKSVVWLGLWALLTVSSSTLLLSSPWTVIIYAALSTMFAIGLAFHLGGTASFPG
jgi:hypothetical protein